MAANTQTKERSAAVTVTHEARFAARLYEALKQSALEAADLRNLLVTDGVTLGDGVDESRRNIRRAGELSTRLRVMAKQVWQQNMPAIEPAWRAEFNRPLEKALDNLTEAVDAPWLDLAGSQQAIERSAANQCFAGDADFNAAMDRRFGSKVTTS